jgi:hypothetical protein
LDVPLATPAQFGHMARVIKSWADAHANLPIRARWFAKADVAPRSNEAEAKSALLSEGFLMSVSIIPDAVPAAHPAPEYCAFGNVGLALQIGQGSDEPASLFGRSGRHSATADLDFSHSGKLTGNTVIEAFNSKLRSERLSVHRFLSMEKAREAGSMA